MEPCLSHIRLGRGVLIQALLLHLKLICEPVVILDFDICMMLSSHSFVLKDDFQQIIILLLVDEGAPRGELHN